MVFTSRLNKFPKKFYINHKEYRFTFKFRLFQLSWSEDRDKFRNGDRIISQTMVAEEDDKNWSIEEEYNRDNTYPTKNIQGSYQELIETMINTARNNDSCMIEQLFEYEVHIELQDGRIIKADEKNEILDTIDYHEMRWPPLFQGAEKIKCWNDNHGCKDILSIALPHILED